MLCGGDQAMWARIPIGHEHDHRREDHGQPHQRAELAECDLGQWHPALEEPVRVPQRNARKEHVHQPVLHLPLGKLLVPAKQNGGVRGDVGVDQVCGIEMAEDLDDFGLRWRIVFERPAYQFPGLFHRARAIEKADKAIGGVREAMILVACRIAHDIPAFVAVELPRDLCTSPQARFEVCDAIPRLGKCGA